MGSCFEPRKGQFAHYGETMVLASPLRMVIPLFVLFSLVTEARAQSSEPPALSVGGGVGIAFPFHSDFASNALAWHGSIRLRGATHVLIEGVYEQWNHTNTFVTRNITLRNAEGLPIGLVDELRTDDSTTVSNSGVNVLVTGAVGRARISAGGGPGVLTYRDRYEVTLTGCTAVNPQTCQNSVRRDARHGMSLQGGLDLDVLVTSRVSAFGRASVAGPIEDPGAGYAAVVGGLRVSVF